MEFQLVSSVGVNTTNASGQSFQWTYPPYAEHSPGKFAVYIFFAVTFSILGVFGNLLAIISIARENVLRVPENMFIVSLAAADILVAGCVLPLNIAGVVQGELYYYHRWRLCEFLGTVCFSACSCAFWCITGLAVNRMILVCSPKQYKRIFTWRTTPIFSFIPWCIALLTVLPMFIWWGGMEFDPETMFCLSDLDNMQPNMFLAAVMSLSVILSFMSIIVAQFRIKAKRRQLTAIAPNISLMNVIGSDRKGKEKNDNTDDITEGLRQEHDDIAMSGRLLAAIFLSSFIWSPALVAFVTHHIMNYGRDFWAFASLLGHMQPGLDCLCYVIISKYFRRGYKNAIRLIFCCKKRQRYATVANA